ncbi:DNA damage-inducible protein J [Lactobacillus crispatus]|nr:DNA damage-inducible protein J [Lactobacillus crispatus]
MCIRDREIPNKTTKKAMLLADAKDGGLFTDDSPSFTNGDVLIKSLNENK